MWRRSTVAWRGGGSVLGALAALFRVGVTRMLGMGQMSKFIPISGTELSALFVWPQQVYCWPSA